MQLLAVDREGQPTCPDRPAAPTRPTPDRHIPMVPSAPTSPMSRHDLSDTTVAVAAATVALHLNVVAVIWVGVHATVTGGPGTTHTVAYGILIACQAVTAAVWYRTVRRWEQERERSGGAVTGTTEPVPGTLPGR